MNHELVGMIESQELAELLRGPFRRRMLGDIGVQDAARADLHRHKHVHHAEGRTDRHEEIAGDDGVGMVANESGPTLIVTASRTALAQILPHCCERYTYAQL